MRMRTQAEVMRHLKQADPHTAITSWALRSMVLSGAIPSVQVGRKRLIDIDRLQEYLSRVAEPEQPASTFGVIRPLRVNK